MELKTDTTIQVILVANKASIKFRIDSEEKRLYKVSLQLNEATLVTNQTGIALFEDLTRFEEYAWSATKEGYADTTGTLSLMNDTTVNLTMNALTNTGDHGLKGLTLYPNPAHSKLFIESGEIIRRVEICDLRGAELICREVNESPTTFDISGFPNGVYIAKIYRNGLRTESLRVIKTE